MKPDNLGQLDELDQADLILERGVLIGQRKSGFYKVQLFQVENFYAEIFYHAHFNVVIRIETFDDTDSLEPYLPQITIDSLFH